MSLRLKKLLLTNLLVICFTLNSKAEDSSLTNADMMKIADMKTQKTTEENSPPSIDRENAQQDTGPLIIDDNVSKVKEVVNLEIPSLEARVGKWFILKAVKNKKPYCYITKKPKDMVGNHKEDRSAFLIVAKIGKKRLEVILKTGYKYRLKSKANVSIDGNQYIFLADQESAISQDSAQIPDIIEKLKTSSSLLFKAESIFGTYSVDTYNLEDFSKAYNKMMSICK